MDTPGGKRKFCTHCGAEIVPGDERFPELPGYDFKGDFCPPCFVLLQEDDDEDKHDDCDDPSCPEHTAPSWQEPPANPQDAILRAAKTGAWNAVLATAQELDEQVHWGNVPIPNDADYRNAVYTTALMVFQGEYDRHHQEDSADARNAVQGFLRSLGNTITLLTGRHTAIRMIERDSPAEEGERT